MILNGKPYKSFITMDDTTISEGQLVTFRDSENNKIEGYVVKISNKSMTIQREDVLNSENWAYANIEERTIKVQ